jgi:heme/copper-type cytochrome/quinol oxidase subunit 4
MTKEKYNFYSETTKLMDKEDLRVTRLFWFMIGFISAVILTLIFFTNV